MSRYTHKIADVLINKDKYHKSFYRVKNFTGPSLYFHRLALELRHDSDRQRYLDSIYATLASWGMHRMGPGGSKMVEMVIFKQSVSELWDDIRAATQISYHTITDAEWLLLKKIFDGIQIMQSGTRLVGNSKVMAHLVPNIIPPIDRAYTLKFLKGNTIIKNDARHEWAMMKEIISEFFIPVAKDAGFRVRAESWINDQQAYPWDTSEFKVIDNLLIGAGKKRVKVRRMVR